MPNLDVIDAYLKSDEAHEQSMGLSDLDGFLTGIACNPEPISLTEWLDRALGGDNAPGEVVNEILNLFEQTKTRLVSGHRIEPVFWQMRDGGIIAMDWCEGFMDAVKLRPERWDAFMQTDTGSKLMLPILVHMIDDNGNSEMGIPQEELDATLDTAAQTLPTAIPKIYQHIRMITRN